MPNRTPKSLVLVSLLSLFAYLWPTGPIKTATLENNSAQFNPHFILSDEEMQNYIGMTESDIQAFLDDHKGYISRLQIEDKNGLKKTTAKIIYEAAQEHRINPKYILVKLQKEQSLVTDDNPTQKQLDWATGYGVCDACSLDDPKIQKYKGFGIQVDNAAGIMRWYYENANAQPWIKKANITYTIDDQLVTPTNFATAFLYTYTPHIHGNQNFWKLWQKWFDQVFPDGALIKSTLSNTVYLIQDGQKRPFASMTALVSRYNPKLIITAPDSELARYGTANTITLPNYSIVKQENNHYLLDFDTLRPFANAEVVRQLGYNPDEIILVETAELVGLQTGSIITTETSAPLGELIRIKETEQLYFVKDGVYRILMHESIAKTQFPGMREVTKSVTALQGLTLGDPILFQDGTIIKVKNFPEVYMIEHGEKRHITYEAFVGWGLSFQNMIEVDEITAIYHPTGQSIFLREGMFSQTPTTLTNSETLKPMKKTGTAPVSKMVKTPSDQVSYVGEKFTTPVDAYVVAEYDSGKILAAKNIDFIRPMASLTKVMTAYRLMHEGVSLSQTVTYQAADHKATYGNFRVAEGEQIKNSDLLSAMLISSINTATKMIVDSVDDDERAFVARMNEHVGSLGLTKTKFVDITGEEVGNVTTAKEYLTLFRKAVDNAEVKKILGATSYKYSEVLDRDGKPNHFDDHSNVLTQKPGLPFAILASKTGYLDEAGANLVMLIERPSDQKRLIIITMGNADYANRFVEPEKIAQWAVGNF